MGVHSFCHVGPEVRTELTSSGSVTSTFTHGDILPLPFPIFSPPFLFESQSLIGLELQL